MRVNHLVSFHFFIFVSTWPTTTAVWKTLQLCLMVSKCMWLNHGSCKQGCHAQVSHPPLVRTPKRTSLRIASFSPALLYHVAPSTMCLNSLRLKAKALRAPCQSLARCCREQRRERGCALIAVALFAVAFVAACRIGAGAVVPSTAGVCRQVWCALLVELRPGVHPKPLKGPWPDQSPVSSLAFCLFPCKAVRPQAGWTCPM